MDDTRRPLPFIDLPEVDLTDHELTRLVVALADYDHLDCGPTYELVLDQFGQRVEDVFGNAGRIRTLVTRGARGGLAEAERDFIWRMIHQFFMNEQGLTREELLDLVEQTTKGKTKGTSNDDIENIFRGILCPPYKLKNQDQLEDLVGHYLIFRHIFLDPVMLIVSHLEISRGQSPRHPLPFETFSRRNPQAEFERTHVDGVMFASQTGNDLDDDLFAVGRVRGTHEIRTTILRRRLSGDARAGPLRDLAGVRLGIGAIDKLPRAYRVWAAPVSVSTPAEVEALRDNYVKSFSLAPEDEGKLFETFKDVVQDFRYIKKWLDGKHFVALKHPDDPVWSDSQ